MITGIFYDHSLIPINASVLRLPHSLHKVHELPWDFEVVIELLSSYHFKWHFVTGSRIIISISFFKHSGELFLKAAFNKVVKELLHQVQYNINFPNSRGFVI